MDAIIETAVSISRVMIARFGYEYVQQVLSEVCFLSSSRRCLLFSSRVLCVTLYVFAFGLPCFVLIFLLLLIGLEDVRFCNAHVMDFLQDTALYLQGLICCFLLFDRFYLKTTLRPHPHPFVKNKTGVYQVDATSRGVRKHFCRTGVSIDHGHLGQPEVGAERRAAHGGCAGCSPRVSGRQVPLHSTAVTRVGNCMGLQWCSWW